MRKIYELKNQRAALLNEAKDALEKKDMELYNAKIAEVKRLNDEISALEELAVEEGRFDESNPAMVDLHGAVQQKKDGQALSNRLDAARSGNDYANAWASAMKNRATIDGGRGNEAYNTLYNAMTIGGGTPAGSDGGFLVPIEFDNMIHRKMKDLFRLADFFNVEYVSGYTGWRAVETTASRAKLPVLEEAGTVPMNDGPKFKKVTYTIKSYGDRIAVSSELMEDNTAGLMQYLADWFAPRKVMTENDLLFALCLAMAKKSFTAGKEVSELKSALNKGLNTAYSRKADIIGNQSSYDFFDQITDTMGRGLLVPNPADPDVYRFKNRRFAMADDDLIPNRTVTTSGATKGDYYPLLIGYFKSFGTLFDRKALEFATTNIGGNAWATNTTEVRGITRMDAQSVDEDAAIFREIFIPAT